MTTLTIDLSPKLKQQLSRRGISDQQLTLALTKLIEVYLSNETLQQTVSLLEDIFQQTEDTSPLAGVRTGKSNDPIVQLGTQPIVDDITDASI